MYTWFMGSRQYTSDQTLSHNWFHASFPWCQGTYQSVKETGTNNQKVTVCFTSVSAAITWQPGPNSWTALGTILKTNLSLIMSYGWELQTTFLPNLYPVIRLFALPSAVLDWTVTCNKCQHETSCLSPTKHAQLTTECLLCCQDTSLGVTIKQMLQLPHEGLTHIHYLCAMYTRKTDVPGIKYFLPNFLNFHVQRI